MGYTHSWSVQRSHPAYTAAWPAIIDDTRRIIAAVRVFGVVIAGPDGTRRPILNPADGIAFNGDATTDLDYDTFALAPPIAPPTEPLTAPPTRQPTGQQDERATRRPGFTWAFCKTERRPYDLAVAAVLLRCRLLLPDVFLIASNGGWDDEWAHGVLPDVPGAGYAIGARRLIGDLFGDVPAASPFHPGDLPGVPGLDD